MQFRKKPVVIEAVRFDPPASSPPLAGANLGGAGMDLFGMFDEIPEWLKEAGRKRKVEVMREATVSGVQFTVAIQTLEGQMRAQKGDWIIKGVKGEIYPCKPDIFEATYEAVDAGADDLVAGQADTYADHRFIAVRENDDGEYSMSTMMRCEDAIDRAREEVERYGSKRSTVCEVVTTFERRHLSARINPRDRGGDFAGMSVAKETATVNRNTTGAQAMVRRERADEG